MARTQSTDAFTLTSLHPTPYSDDARRKGMLVVGRCDAVPDTASSAHHRGTVQMGKGIAAWTITCQYSQLSPDIYLDGTKSAIT